MASVIKPKKRSTDCLEKFNSTGSPGAKEEEVSRFGGEFVVAAYSYEKSCGALVFRRGAGDPGDIYILMIRHKSGGYRSFPKGHVETGEDEHMTAIREVFEETAVRIRIRSSFRESVHYSPAAGVIKEVVYFLAFTDQETIRPRVGEIAEVEWIPINKAEQLLSHENDRIVFRAALKRIGNPRISDRI